MKIYTNRMGWKLCPTLLALALICACVSERRPARQQGAKKLAPATPPGSKKAPLMKWEHPALTRPVARAAGKVLHLIYTSNADGELEPCG